MLPRLSAVPLRAEEQGKAERSITLFPKKVK